MARWLIHPTSHWKEPADPNHPGYLTGIGHDVHDPSRLSQLLTSADFEMLRKGTSTEPNKRYFDHVIFNIDPRTFGADPVTAEVPSDMDYLVDFDNGFRDPGYPVGQIWNAFAADIQAARQEGLGVIIAMHATVASPVHAQDLRSARAGSLVEGIEGTRFYPGPYRTNLYTKGTGLVPTPIDMNHPLPKFWSSFCNVLKTKVPLGKDIAFRVGGESIVFSANQFDQTCVPTVPGVQWNFVNGQLNGEELGRWLVHALKDYRQIELYAARAIWEATASEVEGCRILVGPGIPWPGEIHKNNEVKNISSGSAEGWYRYSPYMVTELQQAGFPQALLQNCWKFVYLAHQYDPFNYTHPDTAPLALKTDLKYSGKVDNPGFSWSGPPPANQNASYELPYKYKDYVAKALTNPQGANNTYTLSDWRSWWSNPPMIVTEFGVAERGYKGDGMELGGPEDLPLVVLLQHDLMRAQWHWDVRTWLENAGIGWSVWDIFSGWNAMNGAMDRKLPNGTWDFHPTRYQPIAGRQGQTPPEFFPLMEQALFGERP